MGKMELLGYFFSPQNTHLAVGFFLYIFAMNTFPSDYNNLFS